MKKIARHIDYLLLRENRVAIPGLGSVVAHVRPARYVESASCWEAPVRALSFDPASDDADTQLAESVARKEQVEIDKAIGEVSAAVEQMRSCLEEGTDVQLGHAGRLSRLQSGTLTFEPGNELWLSPEYMWLPPVPVATVAATDSNTDDQAEDVRRFEWTRALQRAGRVAAVMLVTLVIGWVLMNLNESDRQENYASVVGAPKSSTPTLVSMPGTAESTLVLVVNRHEDASVPVEVEPEHVSGPYYLIVASLNSRAEADKFIAAYPKMKLNVLEAEGRYRVYAADGTTFAEAAAAQNRPEIAETFASSWVCKGL